MGVFYTSRETVMQALDVKAAAYTWQQIDRAIDSASRNVEGLMHRIFYPLTATKYFDYPNGQMARAGRLWLEGNECVSISLFTSGGVTVPPANFFLEPNEYGPPYDRIDINTGTNSALSSNTATGQRSLALTGVWMGCALEEGNAGTLALAVATTTATSITVANANVGVGRVLRIDTERLIVTEKTYISSTQTATLTANLNNTSISVSDGTVFSRREELLIDSERVLIQDIIGNTLIVKRAVAGTALAAHTSALIYFGRQLTVTRGALGTTAATHTQGTVIARHINPPGIEELTVAYALTRELNELSGYSRVIGQGDAQASATVQRTLADLEDDVRRRYGRKARMRAV